MYRENIQKTMQNYCLPIERAFLIIFLNYSAADSDIFHRVSFKCFINHEIEANIIDTFTIQLLTT